MGFINIFTMLLQVMMMVDHVTILTVVTDVLTVDIVEKTLDYRMVQNASVLRSMMENFANIVRLKLCTTC